MKKSSIKSHSNSRKVFLYGAVFVLGILAYIALSGISSIQSSFLENNFPSLGETVIALIIISISIIMVAFLIIFSVKKIFSIKRIK